MDVCVITAHKIHISEASHEELVKDGGFQMKLRGTLDIKVGPATYVTTIIVGASPCQNNDTR